MHYTILAKKEMMSLLTKTISSIISSTTNVDNGIMDMVIFENAETQRLLGKYLEYMSATICKYLLSNVITKLKHDLRD